MAASPGKAAQRWYLLRNPINPAQLTEMPFGYRSHWLQPWRSTLQTRPARWLQNAIGINLNSAITPQEVSATVRLLRASGFRRARIEISWSSMSYDDPAKLADPTRWGALITALRANGIRPLILLNANHVAPTPMKPVILNLTAPAEAGSRTLSLAAASATHVVPGLTGINTDPLAAGVLITNVSADGLATLSQPLPRRLPPGRVSATTLRYAPFAAPYLANGTPNPRFEQTLAGWLTYVKGVGQFVRDTYGSDNFDVEVWNELTFGSDFLDESNYFSSVPDPGSRGGVTDALLQRTVQVLRNPASGLTHVRIGDGFSNESPWTSGTTVPRGTDAIDKHPYAGVSNYPGSQPNYPGVAPLDALGRASHTDNGAGGYRDSFIPHYRVFMPEYFLTGIQTETLMRDLSAIQTTIHGTPHGATTHQPGSRPPTMWITETNMDAHQATALDGLPAADVPELQAKAALRFYVSLASEGVQAIDLFAAKGGDCCQVISQRFFDAVDANPSSYPKALGGRTMQAVGRLASALAGAQNIGKPRQLTLDAIASKKDSSQFTGDGTTAHPNLYDRDVLAFFPFQISRNRFVSAVYVMSRDITHYYTSRPRSGATPYDMPEETFRITVGNVDGLNATVSLVDPLTGAKRPAQIVFRDGSYMVVQLPVTDSPRLLTIDDAGRGVRHVTSRRGLPVLTAPASLPAAVVRQRGIPVRIVCRRRCDIHVVVVAVGWKGQGLYSACRRRVREVRLPQDSY